MAPPSSTPKITARSIPAASMTAITSSTCSSTGGMGATRSESPVPRRSIMAGRDESASRRKNRASRGSSQRISTLPPKPGTSTRFSGPSPTTWYASRPAGPRANRVVGGRPPAARAL